MSSSNSPTPQLILGFPDYETQAHRLARLLNVEYATVELHRFPDGESKLRLPAQLPERIALCRSLDHPNDKLIELMLASATAREAGVKHSTLVAPYLCYMRQDAAFRPGEAVSQRIIGHWLGTLFDALITVDPHLHRTHALAEVVPQAHTVNLSAAPHMAGFLRGRLQDPLIFGPDSESRQWVEHIAHQGEYDFAVAEKIRLSDKQVEIDLPDIDLHNRTVVIADDIASTGRTLALAARKIIAAGAAHVHCLVTHPLFNGDALPMLTAAGIENIWCTDSINHSSNTIELASLLAAAFTK